MNPKCLGRPLPDTIRVKSAHLTGLKMIRITRGVSFSHLVSASTEVRVLTARTLLRSWHTKILGVYLMFSSLRTSLTNRILITLRFAPRGRINETYPNAFSYG